LEELTKAILETGVLSTIPSRLAGPLQTAGCGPKQTT